MARELARIGWSMDTAFGATDDQGHRVSFIENSPALVKRLLIAAVHRELARALQAR